MALNSNNEREFKVLTEREHVLERPAMYIGSIDSNDREMWILNKESNVFEFKSVHYNPGAIKCFSEILDNCLDAAIDGNFKTLTKISVSIKGPEITVIDNGPGIPVEVASGDAEGRTKPQLAWCQARAGTSFNENRGGIGANGLGSTCTNIFSTYFEGTSDDGKHRQTIICENNMASIKASPISKSPGKSGVSCKFKLDYKRFGMDESSGFDDIHQMIIYQRMLILAMMYPKVKFNFNGKPIVVSEANFSNLFSPNALSYTTGNTRLVIFENSYDAFHSFTYVNGLEMPRGGTHVNYITDTICYAARDILVKKFKTIKPGDIKSRICVAILLTDFKNPEFDAQNKEQLTNSQGAITAHLNGKLDFQKIAKELVKTPAIADPIIETFKLKEEVKDRVALKQSLKAKLKVDADKYLPPVGKDHKYVVIAEGFCMDNSQEVFVVDQNRNVPIGEVKVGDLVLTHNQNIQPITDVTHKVCECVKIKTKTGKEVICSAEHRLFVYDKDIGSWKFKKVKNLVPGTDFLVSSKLATGFVLREFTISETIDQEILKKYKLCLHLGDEDIFTTPNHMFTVFYVNECRFDVVSASNLNSDIMRLVMVSDPS